MGVFVVADFGFVLKINMAPFLVPPGALSAQNSGITQERLVVRVRRRLHRVIRKILHTDAALLQKFLKVPNSQKCLYYSKGIFLGQFMKFVRFCGNSGYFGFPGRRFRFRPQNLGLTRF